jgi:hypothetical protein
MILRTLKKNCDVHPKPRITSKILEHLKDNKPSKRKDKICNLK